MELQTDSGWAAVEDGDVVVVHAGADLVYEVHDLGGRQRAAVVGWFAGAPVVAGQLGNRHDDIISLLTTLGAIRRSWSSSAVELRWVGDVDGAIQSLFIRTLTDVGINVVSGDDSDALLMLVKTNVSMYECAFVSDELVAAGRTHLFCDLGFDHTITIGPTVVPGQTACVRCLAERIGGRWTDTVPPAQPNAIRDGAIAMAALLARSLRLAAPSADGSPGVLPFLNEVVSINLDRLGTTHDRVFRNPWCSACAVLR